MALTLHNQITVGVSVVQGPDSTIPVEVFLKAHPDNAGVVYVGTSSEVATDNGFPLAAKDIVILKVSNLDDLYFIASAASQVLAYICYEL